MNELIQSVIKGSNMQKALFLAVAGIGFVFLVQLIFYLVIKVFTAFSKQQ